MEITDGTLYYKIATCLVCFVEKNGTATLSSKYVCWTEQCIYRNEFHALKSMPIFILCSTLFNMDVRQPLITMETPPFRTLKESKEDRGESKRARADMTEALWLGLSEAQWTGFNHPLDGGYILMPLVSHLKGYGPPELWNSGSLELRSSS